MPLLALHLPLPRFLPLALACAGLCMMLAPVCAMDAAAPATAPAPPLIPPDTQPQYWFGVAVENIPTGIAKQLKLKPDQGVMVVAVFADSPAAKAGIRPDDLLIEINGKSLTSQEDLAKAANTTSTIKVGAGKTVPPIMQISEVTYLREGDHHTTRIAPELRPADMAVSGSNGQKFTPNGGTARTPEVRNLVLSNGINVQYGPGYQLDAQSQTTVNLRQAVGNGKVFTITQEADDAGHVVNTINDGAHNYVIEPGKVDQLPDNLRPIAAQLLAQQAASANKPETTDDRLKKLEQQNEALRQQLDELKTLLLKATQPAYRPATSEPGK